jgi:hypothetical protein
MPGEKFPGPMPDLEQTLFFCTISEWLVPGWPTSVTRGILAFGPSKSRRYTLAPIPNCEEPSRKPG